MMAPTVVKQAMLKRDVIWIPVLLPADAKLQLPLPPIPSTVKPASRATALSGGSRNIGKALSRRLFSLNNYFVPPILDVSFPTIK